MSTMAGTLGRRRQTRDQAGVSQIFFPPLEVRWHIYSSPSVLQSKAQVSYFSADPCEAGASHTSHRGAVSPQLMVNSGIASQIPSTGRSCSEPDALSRGALICIANKRPLKAREAVSFTGHEHVI